MVQAMGIRRTPQNRHIGIDDEIPIMKPQQIIQRITMIRMRDKLRLQGMSRRWRPHPLQRGQALALSMNRPSRRRLRPRRLLAARRLLTDAGHQLLNINLGIIRCDHFLLRITH